MYCLAAGAAARPECNVGGARLCLNLRCALSRVSQFCSCVKVRRPIRRSTAVMSELLELDTLTALPWEVLEYILSCLSAEDLGRQARLQEYCTYRTRCEPSVLIFSLFQAVLRV